MRRTLSMLGGFLLAIALSQFPEYAQQYTQRLGGAVDELRVLVQDFDRAATDSGLTRSDALGRFATTGDTFIQGRGTSMERTFARYEMLSATLAEIEGATGWQRFTLLPKYLDTEIGARTLDNFQPAVPVTMEGFAYAAAGLLLGYLLTSGLLRFLMLPFRRRRRLREDEVLEPVPEARKIAVLQPRPVDPPPRERPDEPYFAPPPPVVTITPERAAAPASAPQPEPVRVEPIAGAPVAPQRGPAPAAPPRPAPEPLADRPTPAPSESGTYVHPAVAAARQRAAVEAAARDIKKSLYPG
jgi:hypothetical protein